MTSKNKQKRDLFIYLVITILTVMLFQIRIFSAGNITSTSTTLLSNNDKSTVYSFSWDMTTPQYHTDNNFINIEETFTSEQNEVYLPEFFNNLTTQSIPARNIKMPVRIYMNRGTENQQIVEVDAHLTALCKVYGTGPLWDRPPKEPCAYEKYPEGPAYCDNGARSYPRAIISCTLKGRIDCPLSGQCYAQTFNPGSLEVEFPKGNNIEPPIPPPNNYMGYVISILIGLGIAYVMIRVTKK